MEVEESKHTTEINFLKKKVRILGLELCQYLNSAKDSSNKTKADFPWNQKQVYKTDAAVSEQKSSPKPSL